MGRPPGYQWEPLGLDSDPVPGDPGQISQEVEPVTTEKLGTGLKSQYLQRYQKENDLTGVLNYAWRVEELETDLRVFTACGDLGRLAAAAPAIDELIHQISVEPR